MQPNELAALMLRYAELSAELKQLETAIKDAVFAEGKTVKVGSITASYSGGRGAYDYAGAVVKWGEEQGQDDYFNSVISLYSKETTVTDWKAVCNHLKITAPYTPGTPTVTIKIG